MSERTLKLLLIAVVGLAVLWLGVSYFPGGGGGSAGPSEDMATLFDDVTPESVSRLSLRGPAGEEEIDLRRENGEWKVNGFRADSATVARFWEALKEAEVGDLVASNPANHPRMGVSADSAWTMELGLAGGSRSLLMGSSGARYGTSFVRLPDADQVYLLTGNLRSQVTRSLDDWRNKRVATVDTAGVWRIELERDEGGYTLERADSLWVLGDGAEANPTSVRGILGEIARLDATGFYEEGDSLPGLEATLRALDQAGGVRLILEVGSGEGDRWVRAAGDSITYQVASWRVSRLLPDLEAVTGGG
ncbi:MAG: DUF4340 domain-containing protein [Gemmatimonadota bacterium]|jgi:hypothetical protein